MNNIDRLFNDALHDHATPPRAGMWERVAAGIPVAGHRTWLRWVAVLVPAVTAFGLWVGQPNHRPAVATVETKATPFVPAVVTPKHTAKEEVAVTLPRKRAKVSQAPLVAYEVPAEPQPVVTLAEELKSPEEITIEPAILDTEPVVTEPEPAKPIVLVYTLDAVSSPDDAARKETSLERVVEFARAVKHSDPIGDIRGLKDEFFAFDFRKKQTKKN